MHSMVQGLGGAIDGVASGTRLALHLYAVPYRQADLTPLHARILPRRPYSTGLYALSYDV